MTKILWLYKFLPLYDFDNFLHMKFVETLSRYPEIELFAYGPDLNIGYPNVAPIEYKKELTLHQLRDIFKFDVIIVNTKSRCFDYYDPKQNRAEGCWFPEDFKDWKYTKKIVIEEDAHYEKDGKWYQEMGIDLILQRHYSQSLRDWGVPCKWHPFSVDTKIFNPEVEYYRNKRGKNVKLSNSNQRISKIAFVGNNADSAYIYRKSAIEKLLAINCGANFAGSKKIEDSYVNVLREYVAYVSCGSIYEICAAKNFEIMASGGLLFTNHFQGIDKLFPEDTYVSYSNDCSDVINKANRILNDPLFVAGKVQNGLKHIKENHTHEIRIKQLLDIIKELK